MKLAITLALAASGLLAAATHASAEEIRVGGGAAPIENIFKPIKAAFEERSGVRLVLRADGPDKAMLDLAAGKLDVATGGLSFKDLLDLLKSGGHDIGDPAAYQHRVVGSDKIQVMTHKGLAGVAALSKEQLKSLFTGKATNWKDVGGPDVPVVLVFGTKIPGTNKKWQERVMDSAAWGSGRREVGDAAAVKKMVAGVPGALGIGPLAADDGSGVHVPQTPEVARPITAITKGAPSAAVQRLYEFIQADGQKYVAH